MDNPREIEGMEFDWFATDELGQFALFATAGAGPLPQLVLASIAAHDAIGEEVEISGWGTNDVWQSYSRAGLYAYDWSSTKGRYLRVAEPCASLKSDLGARLSACPSIPTLQVSFSQATAIEPTWQAGT